MEPPEVSSTTQDISARLVARATLKEAKRFRKTASQATKAAEKRRAAARKAFVNARSELVQHQLDTMPLGRIREITEGRLRLGPIEAAGYTTVNAAAAAGRARLQQIPGVGPRTAVQVIAAARQLEVALKEGVRFRFDPVERHASQALLLEALREHEVLAKTLDPIRDDLDDLSGSIKVLAKTARKTSSRVLMFVSRRRKKEEALAALTELAALVHSPNAEALEDQIAEALNAVDLPAPSNATLWEDYERRAATYNGFLIDVAEETGDADAIQGYVPTEVAERAHAHPLDTSLLRVSLRGYQAFGAKFALAQGQAIVGDEMGLGKTVEALAAMCHLANEGASHFLVVCPASVLVNWVHETERHSELRAYRLHGADRDVNLKQWMRLGGVGVTTFESLRSLTKPSGIDIAMLVVDEAHYVKNPSAQRTLAVKEWIRVAKRTVFLTGTAMENRVEEFRTLVHHLHPKVAQSVSALDGLAGATAFRRAVAPVYLRRNQADVLEELPARIEVQDWVDLEGLDFASYCEAVASGNFMAMRQAAYPAGVPKGSAKLTRLVEIVEEAASSGRKVVVFSYFRQVLSEIARALEGFALPQLTGSVSPSARQKIVDDFTARPEPCALVSQIQAGGVGLNMQAGSVVILAEPQWKPSMEEQAIARCHRMGQARPVNVHRLLADNSVDQRMLEILAAKAVLFDEYVRRSELKDISADAIDVSDLGATKEVVSQAEAERRIVELERRRLGIAPVEPIALATTPP